ncbi:MAG: non-heme iron oxygenase ferredoxin subunit [Candidatus Aenigmarchaeota archaeon]|nr:non-heme iron oxygenase ferredoxin subunit [Candidatus Aenigmarchaeota archaeon]
MAFVKVANKWEIKEGEPKAVEIDGKEVMLSNVGGKIFAVSDICSHKQCSLSGGFMEGFEITCPCHMARFDVRNGKVMAPPATVDIKSYPVKIEGDDILVDT